MNEKNSILIYVSLTAAGLVVEVGFENKSTDPGIHVFFTNILCYIFHISSTWTREQEKGRKEIKHYLSGLGRLSFVKSMC